MEKAPPPKGSLKLVRTAKRPPTDTSEADKDTGRGDEAAELNEIRAFVRDTHAQLFAIKLIETGCHFHFVHDERTTPKFFFVADVSGDTERELNELLLANGYHERQEG
jgi:hypothetical protein